jgi:hypothetical protein
VRGLCDRGKCCLADDVLSIVGDDRSSCRFLRRLKDAEGGAIVLEQGFVYGSGGLSFLDCRRQCSERCDFDFTAWSYFYFQFIVFQ